MAVENRIEVIYYTDPLCCWSWALEPQWRKFVYQFRAYISWRYCLCGLIPDWNNFVDDRNSVVRPAQLGPLWMEASMASGMPIKSSIWHLTPPKSSFPSCIAVKCAFLQSNECGELFLRCVRENVMINGYDTSSTEVLFNIAQAMSTTHKSFDLDRFTSDYKGNNGKDAFRKDWLESRGRGISRFPTILMSRGNDNSVLLSGYNTFSTLRNALLCIMPSLSRVQLRNTLDEYRKYWTFLTPREESEFATKTA